MARKRVRKRGIRLARRFAAIALTAPLAGESLASPPASDYDLTFADEFNGATLDTVKWNYNYPWGRTHNHRAYMTESQVIVGSGQLDLQAIAQRDPGAPATTTSGGVTYSLDYTSGAVNTSGKYNLTYGYLEARIKMADVAGTWPAFWTLQSGWPPEIDVMEFPRGASNSATQYWANYHYTNSSGNPASYGWQTSGPNFTSGFNTFGVEWTASAMNFYLNGVLQHAVTDTAAIADSANMYMILNQAVGGWPGDPPSNTPFPSDYLIDYIRVWQKRPAGASTTSTWNIDGAGSWTSASSWSGIVPNFGDQVARFGRVGSATTASVTWTNSRTVGSVVFEGGASGTTAYILAGTALQLANTASGGASVQALSTSSANQTINARLELYNNTTFQNDMAGGQLLSIQGSIIGAANLTIEGAGTVVLTGNNSGFAGNTTIDAGTQGPAVLRTNSSTAFGSGSVLIGAGGNATTARLELNSNVNIPNAITFAGRNTATPAIVNFGGSNTLSGTLFLASGGGNFWIQSDAGTLTVSGTVTSVATGARLLTMQGASNGIISGTIQNAAATLSLVKAGSGIWTLSGDKTYTGSTTVNAGKLVLSGSSLTTSSSLTVAAGATAELAAGSGAVLKTATLTINGRLDMKDNKLITPSAIGSWTGSAYNGVTALIAAGRNGGDWSGDGIVTSQPVGTLFSLGAAIADQVGRAGGSFGGVGASSGDTLVMFTYAGDANLDGKINVDDYGRIDLNAPLGTAGWYNGDFNYDGKINVDDYGIIDFAVGIQGPPLGTSASSITAVPEPSSTAALIAGAAVAVAARRRRRRRVARIAAALASAVASPALAQNQVTFSTVAANGYAAGDINSCAIGINNLATVGTHQFIAYYDNNRNVMIGRRDVGSSSWQTYGTGISIASGEITDDHNVIGMAVDSSGFMHLSWNMHNVPLNYAISNANVTGATLSSINFTTQTSANAPTLFPDSGSTTNSVTYPQFYTIPNSNNLLFTYRNGGAGGGSGNGNQYFNVYNPSTSTWTNNFVINGEATSVNAYLNTLAYTSTNNLMASWTWRATPNWQTNSNIMFAQSPDNGTSWFKFGGTTQYTLPIIQSGSPATSVAEVIKNIPQNSSFINQTSMTVDGNDRPLIATYFAPGWDPSTSSGDPNRQYMLVYHEGTQWRTSQVSNRTSDTSIDSSGSFVRDLGRPIVLSDNEGRVLVVTRSEDTSMGASSNAGTVGNDIVVYYNTVASLDSATPDPWQSITLDTVNMGTYEPTYDPSLWKAQNKLSLLYEPMGLGSGAGTIKVLDWDEVAYFDNPPTTNSWNNAGNGNWDTAGNWTVGVPNASAAAASFGDGPVAPTSDTTVTINGTKTVGALAFTSPTFDYRLVNGASGALALNNGAAAANITVNSGDHTIAVPITIGSAGVNITANSTASLTISGNVSGSGALTKSGGSTLILSGSNSYSGTTTVNGGTLRVLGSAALSSSSNLSLNGGILESNVNVTRTLGSSAGRIRLPGGASGFAASGSDITITINNTGSISWGTSNFAPGTLVFNNASSINNVNLAANISLNSGSRSVQVNGAAATMSGIISSNFGSLGVNGAGTLVLSNSSNTYGGGTSINSVGQGSGTVRAAASNALGTGTITTGSAGNNTSARLELVNGITLPNNVTFTGRNSSSVAIENVSGVNTLAGNVTLSTGGGNYWIQSDSGLLTLSGTLSSTASGSRNVTLQGAGNGQFTGTIQDGSAALAITKSGAGMWTLAGNNTYSGPTTVNVGKLTLGSSLTTSSSLTVGSGAVAELAGGAGVMLRTPSLSISGKLDVKDNKIVTSAAAGSWNGSAYTGVSGLIAAGRNGGAWNGNGIVSSSATSQLTGVGIATGGQAKGLTGTSTATWAGQTISAGDSLVMYTYGGDANLDGKINVDDYGRIDLSSTSGVGGWYNGDFNYDGKINVDDYGIIDFNVGVQGAPFSTVAVRGVANPIALAAVPEPTGSLMLCGVAVGAATLSRRRRRSL